MKICIFLQCAISPTKTNYLAALFFTDIVNVYPQAINRMSSDENKNLSTLNPCDLQIISQQKGVNLASYLYSLNKRKVACLPVPSTIPLFKKILLKEARI